MTREEAIKNIKKALPLSATLAESFYTLHPELRESEDERIRKWILLQMQEWASHSEPCSEEIRMIDKAIDWLEKKKEQKPELCDMGRWDEESYNNGIHHVLHNPEAYGLTKQSSAEKQDYSGLNDLERAIHRGFLCAGVENVPITIINETAQECLAQMKPAEWSEEDNLGWDEAFACVTRAEKAAKNEEELQNAVTAEKWLKEIKFKYYVHPVKQEWSEEDEEMIKTLVDFYDSFDEDESFHNTTYGGIANWLKSLRPQPKVELTELDKNILEAAIAFVEQNDHFNYWRGVDKHTVLSALRSLKPHWKPSEEQMEALDRCVDYLDESDNEDAEIMESLYNDLKKL